MIESHNGGIEETQNNLLAHGWSWKRIVYLLIEF